MFLYMSTNKLKQIYIYVYFLVSLIMVMMGSETNFLFYVMFWTIIAMMLVLLFSLKQVIVVQRHLENMDRNIEKMVKRTLSDEERILNDLESKSKNKK